MDHTSLLIKAIISSILIAISVIDIKTKKIPNFLILIFMLVLIVIASLKLIDTSTSVYGFAVGGLLLYITALATNDDIGGGDVKLVAVSGLYLGFPGIMYATLYGFGLAALISLVLIKLNKLNKKDYIPLGPFISLVIIIQLILK